MTRYSVNHYRRYIALDQRAYIADKLICYIRAVFIYPFTGNEFFIVGDLVDVLYFRSALVRVIGQSLENDHLPGIAFVRCFDCSAAYLISFQDIHTGCAVRSRALQRTQFDRTGLSSDLTCDITCQIICSSGELFVTERVHKVDALSKFAHIAAVRKADPFGNGNDNG